MNLDPSWPEGQRLAVIEKIAMRQHELIMEDSPARLIRAPKAVNVLRAINFICKKSAGFLQANLKNITELYE